MVLNRQQQQEMLTRMEQAMAQMRKQMEQQLAQMPAEQRQQMQQRMQSMPGMSGKPEPKTSVSDTGESKTVGAYSCRIKSVALDGEPVAEACVASAESLGIGKADADALRAFSDFGAAMSAGSPHPLSSELEGLPIEYRSLADDQVTRIETVDDKAIDATSFQVPAGFQKVDPLASMPR